MIRLAKRLASLSGRLRNATTGGLVVAALVGVFALGYALGGGDHGRDAPDAHSHVASTRGVVAWTCSMHPQIRQPGPGQCPICGMDLISVTSGGEQDLGPRQIRLTPTARALAQVRVAPVQRTGIANEVRLYGKVLYDETAVDHVTAWFPGRIDKLFVDFTGEKVKRGQSLVMLYSPQLLLAQDELIQASRMVQNLAKLSSGDGFGTSKIEETLDASRERLRLWGMSKKQIAAVEKSGKPRKHVTFSSRIEGVVIEKNAYEGMYVEEGTRLFTVADLSSLWVMLDAYESDLTYLQKGQEVKFEVQAYPGQRFEGSISFIDPVIDPSTRTARVRVEVDNTDGMLKPEMFVHAVVETRLDPGEDGDEMALVIPASAPLITGKRAIVYVQAPDDEGLYEGREVTLGPRSGDLYVVLDGLEEGELVVVNGNFKIDSALQIQARPSMMSPEGGAGLPGQPHSHPPGSALEAPQMVFDAPDGFLEQLDLVVQSYLGMQESLASDDLVRTRGGIESLSAALEATDAELLNGDSHEQWMQMHDTARGALAEMTVAGDIARLRTAFASLSEAVIRMVRSFGTTGKRVLYLKHCPMALDDAGANWLQADAQTRNPYFGSAMLSCAEDVQTLGNATGGQSDE